MTITSNAQTLLVAFSGGADSVLAAQLAVATGKPVVLWYMHHYPAPIEPERSRVFAEIEKKYSSVAIIKAQVDVARYAKRLGYSWEHTASLLRRKHLIRFRAEQEQRTGGKCAVITGHNYSDYLETVALRRERGLPEHAMPDLAESDAITGFLRPLYNLTRQEVRQRVAELGLLYFDDPANADESFARNRVRKALVSTETTPSLRATPSWQGRDLLSKLSPCQGPPGRRRRRSTMGEGVRELHLPLSTWSNLSKTEKSRIVFQAFRRLMVVRRFTRNHFDRAHRLPFSLPPFFAHAERQGSDELVVFRRGLGVSAAIPQAGDAGALRGDQISRKVTIAMPYGNKSVAKIFSEKRLSSRERRRTLVFMKPGGSEASSIRFPGIQ